MFGSWRGNEPFTHGPYAPRIRGWRKGAIIELGNKIRHRGSRRLGDGVAVGGVFRRAVAAGHPQIQHVLLISVDGMHQSDLDWYVENHPGSELARLASGGAEYTHAQTSDPSDSDPGGTALIPVPTRNSQASTTTTSKPRRLPTGDDELLGAGSGRRRDL